MQISALLATGIVTLALATGGTLAQDAAARPNFQQIVATMNNVEWTIHQIGTIRDVSDVRLVQLDDFNGRERAGVYRGHRRPAGHCPSRRAQVGDC